MGLVFVDVDGTLLAGPSSEHLFITHLLALRRLGSSQLARAIAFFPQWASAYGVDTAKKNKAYLCDLKVSEITACAQSFVEQKLCARLRPTLLRRLEEHRRSGEKIVLLTGTPDFIAAPLARLVEAEICCATRCRQRDGVFLAEPPEMHPFAEAKAAHARELCEHWQVALADCTAYADSGHDLALLRLVGRPVAVHPDRGLARIARREGWEILIDPPASRRYRLGGPSIGERKA